MAMVKLVAISVLVIIFMFILFLVYDFYGSEGVLLPNGGVSTFGFCASPLLVPEEFRPRPGK
jgi:hypothetical protein